MRTIEIEAMPQTMFAHIHQADRFVNHIKPNQHCIEISYVAEGELLIEKGNETFQVQKDDILCILYNEPMEIHAAQFHCHHTVCASVQWRMETCDRGLRMPVLTKAAEETAVICQMIDDFIYRPYVYQNSPARDANGFLNILCKIDEHNRKQDRDPKTEGDLLAERAVQYIHENLYRRMTQREVAQHLGISAGYLCGIFKKAHGMPLMKYVNTQKLKTMQALMERENMKLCEASQLLGYEDPNYVSALFKKLFGRNVTDRPNRSKESKK